MKKVIAVIASVVVLASAIIIIKSISKNDESTKHPNQNNPTKIIEIKNDSTYPENGLSEHTKINLRLAFNEGTTGKSWMEYAIKTFHQKFKNVNIELVAPAPFVQAKIYAGNNNDMYDIFSTYKILWGISADSGEIEKLDSLWNRSPYDTKNKKLKDLVFNSSYKYQAYSKNGNTYAIPTSVGIIGLSYHKQYFQEKGWNQSPKTYSEFTSLCEKIKASGIYPMTFYGSDLKYTNYLSGLMESKKFEIALENRNKKFDSNFRNYNDPLYTTPESLNIWSKMYEMGKKKYFEPGSSGSTSSISSKMMVIQHKVAMIVSGNWIASELKNAVPKNFTFGYMAMPFVSKASSKLCVQQVPDESLLVWSGKDELSKKWCKEFLLWLENIDVQRKILESGMIPIRNDFVDKNSPLSSKQIISIDTVSRNVKLNDPDKNEDRAGIIAYDARIPAALGKKNPKADLFKAETFYEKALSSGIRK